MMNFLFSRKKGKMEAGVSILGIIVLCICIYPLIKGHLSFNFDSSPLNDLLHPSTEASTEVSEDSGNTESTTDNGGEISNGEDFTFNMEECKTYVSQVRIAEVDSNNDSARGEWETSKKFTCPVSGKKSGMKNYAYELETGLAYNREDFSYICPYTHSEVTNIRNIDYDHIIPINYVDLHGGCDWSTEKKQEYAYNPENGICTLNSPNRAKRDKGPSEYMPEYNQQWYCYKWLEIAVRYDIPLSQADYDVIVSTLGLN